MKKILFLTILFWNGFAFAEPLKFSIPNRCESITEIDPKMEIKVKDPVGSMAIQPPSPDMDKGIYLQRYCVSCGIYGVLSCYCMPKQKEKPILLLDPKESQKEK